MPTGVIAQNPVLHFEDSNGKPLVGGKVYTYLVGTTTPAPTYRDRDLATANTNPVVLDARGECTIWLPTTQGYKFELRDRDDVLIYTADNIDQSAIGELQQLALEAIEARDQAVAAQDAAMTAADESADSASDALVASESAQSSATAAASARDAALIQAGLYPTEGAGRAAVADGQAFKVQGSGDIAAYEYRRINSGSSTLIATYPSSAAIATIQDGLPQAKQVAATVASSGVLQYVGSGPVYPLATDADGKVIMGYNTDVQKVTAKGLDTQAQDFLAGQSQVQYIGSGNVFPWFTDALGAVLLGYDVIKNQVIGPGLGAVSGRTPLIPLAQPVSFAQIMMATLNGQSLSIAARGQPIISTTQPYNHRTYSSAGPRTVPASQNAFGPLFEVVDVGADLGETMCSGSANYVTELQARENGATLDTASVFFMNAPGVGATAIADLSKGSARYNNYFLPGIQNARALMLADGKTFTMPFMLWEQGQEDANNGTTFTAYRDALLQLQADVEADVKSITGQTTPVYLLVGQTNRTRTNSAIALAQVAATKLSSKIFIVSPSYGFNLPNGLISDDFTHLTGPGYFCYSKYYGRAMKDILDGFRPKCLQPISATAVGTTLKVKFDVPYKPLRLDITDIQVATTYGMRVLDTVGTVPLSSISVTAADEVTILLGRALNGAATWRYAIDWSTSGSGLSGGALGNLADSSPLKVTANGNTYPMPNRCVHSEVPIFQLAA